MTADRPLLTLDSIHRAVLHALIGTGIVTAIYTLVTRDLPVGALAAGAAQCAVLAATSTLRLRRARARS